MHLKAKTKLSPIRNQVGRPKQQLLKPTFGRYKRIFLIQAIVYSHFVLLLSLLLLLLSNIDGANSIPLINSSAISANSAKDDIRVTAQTPLNLSGEQVRHNNRAISRAGQLHKDKAIITPTNLLASQINQANKVPQLSAPLNNNVSVYPANTNYPSPRPEVNVTEKRQNNIFDTDKLVEGSGDGPLREHSRTKHRKPKFDDTEEDEDDDEDYDYKDSMDSGSGEHSNEASKKPQILSHHDNSKVKPATSPDDLYLPFRPPPPPPSLSPLPSVATTNNSVLLATAQIIPTKWPITHNTTSTTGTITAANTIMTTNTQSPISTVSPPLNEVAKVKQNTTKSETDYDYEEDSEDDDSEDTSAFEDNDSSEPELVNRVGNNTLLINSTVQSSNSNQLLSRFHQQNHAYAKESHVVITNPAPTLKPIVPTIQSSQQLPTNPTMSNPALNQTTLSTYNVVASVSMPLTTAQPSVHPMTTKVPQNENNEGDDEEKSEEEYEEAEEDEDDDSESTEDDEADDTRQDESSTALGGTPNMANSHWSSSTFERIPPSTTPPPPKTTTPAPTIFTKYEVNDFSHGRASNNIVAAATTPTLITSTTKQPIIGVDSIKTTSSPIWAPTTKIIETIIRTTTTSTPPTTITTITTTTTAAPTTPLQPATTSISFMFPQLKYGAQSQTPITTTTIMPTLTPINPPVSGQNPSILYTTIPKSRTTSPPTATRTSDIVSFDRGYRGDEEDLTRQIYDKAVEAYRVTHKAISAAVEAVWPQNFELSSSTLEPLLARPSFFMLALGATVIFLVLTMMLVVYLVTYQTQPKDDDIFSY